MLAAPGRKRIRTGEELEETQVKTPVEEQAGRQLSFQVLGGLKEASQLGRALEDDIASFLQWMVCLFR